MNRALRPRAFVVCVLLAAFHFVAPVGANQEAESDPQRTVERFREYLARKPFHETAFEKMVEAAISANALDALVEEYRALAAVESPSSADRVVLARLLARTERAEEALALLDASGESSAELSQLRGALLLREHRVVEAVAALDAAAAATEDRKQLEEIHALRGEAWMEAGEREKAIAAYADLVALDPTDFHLRSEAAAELAEQGLPEAALEHYAAAVELAGDDVPALCRALSELGRLHERLGRNDEGLAAYARARAQLARGHWLLRDLEERTLALHARAGTLPAFARELEAAVAANPRELALRELYARTLVELRDLAGARAVLAAATSDFPQDLELARTYLRVLDQLGDADARVLEYQRVLAQHPDELELYIELGQVLASDGRLEQARRQWAKTLEGRMTDVGTCLRLAELHALFGMNDEALALIERAIELEPAEVGHFGELAELHVRAGRPEAVAGVLDRAEAAAGDDGARLETAASLARGYRDLERAARLLERARAARPDDTGLARELADVALERRDDARATALLREIVESAKDPAHRRDAAQRLARLARRSGDLAELARAERMRLREEPADAAALYLAAVFALELGQETRARKYLEPLVEAEPRNEVARAMLAEALIEAEDDAGAIAQYEALMELEPGQRPRWLKEIAAIHVKERRGDEAAACYEEVLRSSPGNAAAFREVAQAYRKLDRNEDALECLVQATRLSPDDGGLHLELAEIHDELGQTEQAEREVLRAVQSEDQDVRARARAALYERLVEDGRLEDEIERLRAAVAENPYDAEKPLALVDLFERELEYSLALDLLDELVRYRPRDATLLRERARLYTELERHEEALADYEALALLPEVGREEIAFDLAGALLALGRRDQAEKQLVQTGDLLRAANLYHRHGLRAEAVEVLEKALGRTPDDRRYLRRLVILKLDARDLDGALAVQEQLVALEGETFENLKGRGRLLHAKGDREGLYTCCQAMLEEVGPIVDPGADEPDERDRKRAVRRSRAKVSKRFEEVRQYLWELGLYEGFEQVAERALRADPTNPAYVGAGLDAITSSGRHEEALAAIETVRAATVGAGVTPVGYDSPAEWEGYLARRETLIVRASPELSARRAAELGAAPAELERGQVDELIQLYQEQERFEELAELLVGAIERFPDETEYLAALAYARLETGALEEAEAALRKLLGEKPKAPAGLDVPKPSRSYVKRLERRLPEALAGTLDEAHLARRVMLDENCAYRDRPRLGARPKEDDIRLQLVRCLAEQGRDDEARAILLEMEPPQRDLVETRAFLAARHAELGFEADAERLRDSVFEVVLEVGADPLLRTGRTWPPAVVEIVVEATQELATAGELARAWELRRRWAGPQAAQAWLRRLETRAAVLAERSAAWEKARLATPEGPDPTGALRDAGILYAELLADASDWAGAGAIYGELAAREPEDPHFPLLVARAFEREGRLEEARAQLWTAADAARERVRAAGKVPGPTFPGSSDEPTQVDPYELVPAQISPERNDRHNLYGELLRAGEFGMGNTTPIDWVPWEIYCDLFRLSFEAGEYAKAAEVLEAMHKANNYATTFVQYEMRSALQAARAGTDAVELYGMLLAANPTDGSFAASYGEALVELGRTDEATGVYRKFLRDTQPGEYGREKIEKALAKLDLGDVASAPKTTAELAAAVEADPRNVRLRSSLVEMLFAESRYEEAVEHALLAAELAPHLDEVRALRGRALVLAGRDDEYEVHLRNDLERTTEPEAQFTAALRLALRLEARGAVQEAVELLDTTVRSGSVAASGQFTAARFVLERQGVDAALEQLGREIEAHAGAGSWQTEQLEQVRARIALATGDPLPALESAWEQGGDFAPEDGGMDRVEALAAVVGEVPDAARAAEAIEAAAAGFDAERAGAYRAVAASLRAAAARPWIRR